MEEYSKYLCIFGGGAVRGYSYLGVLKAFEELQFKPQKIAGSSVGSVFAAFYALDIPLEEMYKILFNINFELFKDINFSFAPTFALSKGGVFLDWIRTVIEKNYYKEFYKKDKNDPVCFKDLKKDLYIISTDLTNGKPFIFSRETTPDFEVAMAIRASAAMPGLLSPVNIDNITLTDGDLLKTNPSWRLSPLLCPDNYRILEYRLEGISNNEDIKTLLDYINTIYCCINNYSTDYIIDMYSQKDKFDYIKIDTRDLILVNFNINEETKEKLINIGYSSTIDYFNHDIPKKRASLLEKYSKIENNILLLEKSFIKRDLREINKIFSDLFFLINESKKYIDLIFINDIKDFYKTYKKNITIGFLRKEKLKNNDEILNKILMLKTSLKDKCTELKNKKF